MSEWAIAIILMVFICPLVTVRDISIFSSCHIIADILIIASAIIIEVCSIVTIAEDGIGKDFSSFTTLYSAMKLIGISTGAYEINAVIIPIYTQAESKTAYHKVQYPAIITVGILYLTFGLFGYIAFGDGVQGPVTLSLNQSSWLVITVELVYIFALIPTILIQIYPAVQLINHYGLHHMELHFICVH